MCLPWWTGLYIANSPHSLRNGLFALVVCIEMPNRDQKERTRKAVEWTRASEPEAYHEQSVEYFDSTAVSTGLSTYIHTVCVFLCFTFYYFTYNHFLLYSQLLWSPQSCKCVSVCFHSNFRWWQIHKNRRQAKEQKE